MLPDLVQFELSDGSTVLVESADSDLVRRHGADAPPQMGGELGDRLTSAAAAAQEISRTLRQRLAPDELTLELGLKVSGQANWFVAKAQTEGTVKVTLKWNRPTTSEPESSAR